LQEIFGILLAEREDQWATHGASESELSWLFGLLCLLEKPLLAEIAGDLNAVLNALLRQRQALGMGQALAAIDVNVCLITEYFE